VPVDLDFQLLLLGGQPLVRLFACLAPSWVLSSRDHTLQIDLRQGLELIG
jgi:hypothetical protein